MVSGIGEIQHGPTVWKDAGQQTCRGDAPKDQSARFRMGEKSTGNGTVGQSSSDCTMGGGNSGGGGSRDQGKPSHQNRGAVVQAGW